MKLTRLFGEFFKSEKTGGLILIVVTLLSILAANTSWQNNYINFWQYSVGGHTLVDWINEGLMAIFFLLIGLELEREIYQGELSNLRNASLPLFGAIGGMVIPALIFLVLNYGTEGQRGAGIPMATDIAFALGILSLLGKKVPSSLKIFLTALAVIDDLGAIIIIAVFYSSSVSLFYLGAAIGIFVFLLLLKKFGIRYWPVYIVGGVTMWYFMLHSGVHATISGVLLAFAIPFGDGSNSTPSYKVQHFLHIPVAFFILPLFAMANTGLILNKDWFSGILEPVSIGIMAGLIIGKPLGILVFSFIGVKMGLSSLPENIKWKDILGIGFLGGIGFTMSVFITLLAFADTSVINNAKMAILIASLVSGIAGFVFMRLYLYDHWQEILPEK